MNASPTPSPCPSCGGELDPTGACSGCGRPAAHDGDTLEAPLPPLESSPGPVSRSLTEPRWLGLPASTLLLFVAFAAVGAACGLLAAGRWPWGIVLLAVAALALAGVRERARQAPRRRAGGPAPLAGGRARAASVSEIWWTRLAGVVEHRRAQMELGSLDDDRAALLRDLGAAVWADDASAAEAARARLADLEERRARIERRLDEGRTERSERIRRARLLAETTMVVAAYEPAPPYPPPDEGDPPQPAPVPEPYPPPDEGTPPAPAPDPGPPPAGA